MKDHKDPNAFGTHSKSSPHRLVKATVKTCTIHNMMVPYSSFLSS